MIDRRIGFVGAGNMAKALVRGFVASGLVDTARVQASDVSEERRTEASRDLGIVTHADNASLARFANLLVIAVKPQVVGAVLEELAPLVMPGTLVISIAAGVTLSSIEGRLPAGTRAVRAMPNTPAIAGAAATAVSAGSHATPEDLELATTLFGAVGRVVTVDEGLMDAVTGLSGSGPAYVMLMIEALTEGGVKVGLGPEAALLLASQTVYGAAKLLLETGEQPARLREMVTSPGGTTVAGLKALESGGLRTVLIDAVKCATERAHELGRGPKA